MLTMEELEKLVARGEIESVIVAFPDQFGRLMGKRYTAGYFLSHADSAESCNYLLTTDIEMEPLPGFLLASWDDGYGDLRMVRDPASGRRLAWPDSTAIFLYDLHHPDGTPVAESPRQVLKEQLRRASEGGYYPMAASELEFFLFREHEPLTPATAHSIDYHITATHGDEALLREIRQRINAAGISVESSKGETGRGQYEIALEYTNALEAADRHVIFKDGVKAISEELGYGVTFMAKYSDRDSGSSGHIHMSLFDETGATNLFARNDPGGEGIAPSLRHFIGGLQALSAEFFLLFAPTVNSYKRFRPGSFAPTAIGWGLDNRTAAYRVAGHGSCRRVENRLPGADVNPYLAYAAMLAAGCYGIEQQIEPGEAITGNAYNSLALPRVPATLAEAAERFENSAVARELFSDRVVEFYVRHARLEEEAYRNHVSTWERERYFRQI